jgi:tellurium resistance protein TerD
MSSILSKGEAMLLPPGLPAIMVGFGWDARSLSGEDFDLDASAIMLDGEGRITPGDSGFIFFNNLRSPDGSVVHSGDNLTGEGEGDEESIMVFLTSVPPECARMIFAVSIYDGEIRNQSFGGVRSMYIRIVGSSDGSEIVSYPLDSDASVETALIFGEIGRRGNDWEFRAASAGFLKGLTGIAEHVGLRVT